MLVCVHGWLLAGRLWDPLLQHWGERRCLWCPDLPGFGTRPRPRGLQPSLASYGRWLASAAQQQAGGRPLVLVGHSLGGSIALHAAAGLGDQLQGLVLVGFGGGIYQPRPFATVRGGGATFLRWRPSWLAQLPVADAIASPLRADLHAARGLLACSMSRQAVAQLPPMVQRLEVPSLWISGSRDGVMAPRYVRHLAGYSAAHTLVELPGIGHLPMRQAPAQLAAAMDSWLDQRLASPRS
ncbi:MAG: alpha/beta hydrolase [Cyanobacteriota bacterium]|nr:alpha/beta hydrolase [Cyanobacteriota bacterium]